VQTSLGKADSAVQSSSLKTINGKSIIGSGNISTMGAVDLMTAGAARYYLKIGNIPQASGVEYGAGFNYISGNATNAVGTAVIRTRMDQVIMAENYLISGDIQFGYAPDPDHAGYFMIVAYLPANTWAFDIQPYNSFMNIDVKKYENTRPDGWVAFTDKKFAWQ
jgi:hypothetical protein